MPAKLAAVALLLLAGSLASAQVPGRLPALPDLLPPPAPPAVPAPPKRVNLLHKPAATLLPAALPQPADIKPVQAYGLPRGASIGLSNEQMDYLIQLVPGSPDRIFRLQSEQALDEQIRQESREAERPSKAQFPPEPPATEEPYKARHFEPQVTLAEAHYVNYKRLYFQDINAERYDWEMGFAEPFASAALFFADVILLPYHFASRPCDCVESSAGYCLKADPVPFMWYPPDLSTTGALGEAAAIIGLIAIFP
jgi:hypothetical protein